MTEEDAVFRVLIVDDEEDIAGELQAMLCEDLGDLGLISVETEQDFAQAELILEREQIDLVVLDVRDSSQGDGIVPGLESRGRELYDRIAKTRWVPVIFCTNVPGQVQDLAAPPLVQVVTKHRLDEVEAAVRAGLQSGVPSLTRRLGNLVDREIRDFLRGVIAPNWSDMAEADQQQIAPLLVHRLAAWLKENAIRELDGALDGADDAVVGHASAARTYLKPPVTVHLTAADLLRDPEGSWWLVLTPACDLYEDLPTPQPGRQLRKAKAEYVRVAKADPLFESALVAKWKEQGTSKARDAVLRVFRTDDNRFRLLPQYLEIPHLLLDLENVKSVPLAEARSWDRVATLDSPFAEAMLTAHSHAVGRIGTPDLVFERLKEELGLKGKKSVPPARSAEQQDAVQA
ncbi:hypothetical protein ACFXHD_05635 [Streptomyces hydrogenans]|uniref:hypothetical protein n=1 Tax=Streptomyces hydrogenans TaxID=1873719 RepID=UPI0036B5359E